MCCDAAQPGSSNRPALTMTLQHDELKFCSFQSSAEIWNQDRFGKKSLLNHPSAACVISSPLSNGGRHLTGEAGKVFLQVRGLDLVSQDVGLVEEEDDGGVLEPGRMDGGVEQRQALVHAVLQRQTGSEAGPVLGRGWCWCRSHTSLILGFYKLGFL